MNYFTNGATYVWAFLDELEPLPESLADFRFKPPSDFLDFALSGILDNCLMLVENVDFAKAVKVLLLIRKP